MQYKAALAANGLRAFQGNVAAVQPGKLSDLMLHETAVAWMDPQESAHHFANTTLGRDSGAVGDQAQAYCQ